MRGIRLAGDRGMVLLVVLGVLAVLGLLAATFATLSRVERSVSNSYVDQVRARMLAQSGVERALASLRGRAMVQAWDDTRNDWYYREMLNAAGGGLTYPAGALAAWAPWVPARAYGAAPRGLGEAMDAGRSGGPCGVSFPDPANPAVSGALPGTYEPMGDVYALKVLDCASMLNVNDGHAQIVRMLDNLGDLLACADGTPVSAGGFRLGEQVRARAVARGRPFAAKSEVRAEVFLENPFFGGDAAAAGRRFDAVRDFITCHGWTDGTTTRFVDTWTGAKDYVGGSYASAISGPPPAPASSGGSADGVPANPIVAAPRNAPGAYASLSATRVFAAPPPSATRDPRRGGGFQPSVTGSESDTAPGKFGGPFYVAEPRTPVNVNTASKEVLVACLMDLQADFWDYTVVSESATPREYNARLGNIPVTLTKAEAEDAADFILSGRSTFGVPAGAWSYNDWMHFEDEVIQSIPGLSRFQKALVKANANPNSNIRKLCPDLIMVSSNPAVPADELVRLDKSDVKQGSTDWTFSSNGFFEIESIGRVMSGGQVRAEERIETVVKVFDVLRYSTQEQFEQDRLWAADDSKEGDLMAGGYPPVVSMPEYAYNGASNPVRYRSATGDTTWCADYEGYLILNGPAKVAAGTSPGSAAVPTKVFPGTIDPARACWGRDAVVKNPDGTVRLTQQKPCAVSFVAGFNLGSLYPNQSHRHAWHDSPDMMGGGTRHADNPFFVQHCFGDGGLQVYPLLSSTLDTNYQSILWNQKRPHAIDPAAAEISSWGPPGLAGANFWDNGCDLQSFGIYVNGLRRGRFLSYWGDEVPSPDCTIEMTVKPEIDLWTWATKSKAHSGGGGWGPGWTVPPCSRQYLFELATPGYYGLNYAVRCYAQLSRIYLEFYHQPTGTFHILYGNHQWKPHTWHHVEASWVRGGAGTPPNAMLFIDGAPATGILLGTAAAPGALALPDMVHPVIPMNFAFPQGPRFTVGSFIGTAGVVGEPAPAWHGLIDNVVMHHWRAHDAAFTPRNRYHSVSYYDGKAIASATGYKLEKAGVYKKRLVFLEGEASAKDVTIGTVSCTHYHPYHVHLNGHGASTPTTSFGHITPALRVKTGGSYIDSYYYDGCVGVPVKSKVPAGSEISYLAWFEVASLVPVTMSPILCDFTVTYFTEPATYVRLSSSEVKR